MYPRNGRVLLQITRNGKRVVALPFHAQRQRFQAARHQESVEWAEHGSQHSAIGASLSHMRVLGADHYAGGRIAVTAYVLGGAMYHDVEVVFNRLEQVGRGESAVNDGYGPHLARGFADSVQVDQFDQWI